MGRGAEAGAPAEVRSRAGAPAAVQEAGAGRRALAEREGTTGAGSRVQEASGSGEEALGWSSVAADEEVRLFPAIARPLPGGEWEVTLRAWVFEPERDSLRRQAAIEGLRRALELPAAAPESAIFRARAQAFIVDNERGEEVVVAIGGERRALARTGPNGQSVTTLRVRAGALGCPVAEAAVVLPPGDGRRFAGAIHCLDPGSMSVVSDIDDTIKVTEVRDREALLRNTFLRPPAAVPGMAAAYQRWAAAGARFHYVSASPWQLSDALAEFMAASGFPAGSQHLKEFRWKDRSFFNLFEDPVEYKLAILRPLLAGAPGRGFVLVGDSGERDPEIYGALAREFPGEVAAIFIRDVSGEGREAARYAAAFAGVPAERWAIFADAGALPRALGAGEAAQGAAR